MLSFVIVISGHHNIQLQALQVRGSKEEASIEVARPQIFDGASSKISGFIMACRLYIRMKMQE